MTNARLSNEGGAMRRACGALITLTVLVLLLVGPIALAVVTGNDDIGPSCFGKLDCER